MKKSHNNIFQIFKSKKFLIIFCGILLFSIFIRLYKLEELNPFGWDQLDNAWAAVRILINHNLPLVGMQAKANSGVFIGPLYYYFVSFFYFLTNLDPVASGIIAVVTSIFSISTLYFVVNKIFNKQVALIASFIYAVAFSSIVFDRVQWPVGFIPAISLLIFYCLYKIATGNSKYIILLFGFLGLSFHIHFTAIFYPIIILLSLPFFPRNKMTIKYSFFGFIIFAIFMLPTFIYFLSNLNNFASASHYGNSYYHGLHLRRVAQLVGDAFIQFDFYLKYDFLKPIKYVFVPLFIFTYAFRKPSKETFILTYLTAIFFLVPWIVMSTYSGELSDYYFSSTRFIALAIISYFIFLIFSFRGVISRIAVILALLFYAYWNVNDFLNINVPSSISSHREKAINAVNVSQSIGFFEGDPGSYYYYYYMYRKGIKVY